MYENIPIHCIRFDSTVGRGQGTTRFYLRLRDWAIKKITGQIYLTLFRDFSLNILNYSKIKIQTL